MRKISNKSKPNKDVARAILEYLSWEDCRAKENFKIIFEKELAGYMNWLDNYCKLNNCSDEEALIRIINDY